MYRDTSLIAHGSSFDGERVPISREITLTMAIVGSDRSERSLMIAIVVPPSRVFMTRRVFVTSRVFLVDVAVAR